MKNIPLSIYLSITAMLLIFASSLIRLEYLYTIMPDPLVGADCTRIRVRNDYDSEPISLSDLEYFFHVAQDNEFTLIYSSRYGKIILSNTDTAGLHIIKTQGMQKHPIAAYVGVQDQNSFLQLENLQTFNANGMKVPLLATFDKDNEMLDDYYLRWFPDMDHSGLNIPIEGELWLSSKENLKMATQFKLRYETDTHSIQILPSLDFAQRLDTMFKALDMHLYMVLAFVLSAALLCMNSVSVILFGIKRQRREIAVRRVCGASDRALYRWFLINYWRTLSIAYIAAIAISSLMQRLPAFAFLQLRVDAFSVLIAFPFHLLLGSVVGLFSIKRALRQQIAQILR